MDRMHGRFNMMDTPSLLFRSGLSPLSFSVLSFLFLSNSLKMVRSSCNVGLAPTKSVTWLLMHIAHVCGQAFQYKLTSEGGMERRTTNPNMRKRRKEKRKKKNILSHVKYFGKREEMRTGLWTWCSLWPHGCISLELPPSMIQCRITSSRGRQCLKI